MTLRPALRHAGYELRAAFHLEADLRRLEIIETRLDEAAGVVLVVLGAAGLLSGSLALSALGAVFAREGRVAESNLARQPGRAAVTVSVVMVGLAILVAMAGLMTSIMGGMTGYIDGSLGASDYVVMPQSLLPGGGAGGTGATGRTADIQFVGIEPDLYPALAGLTFRGGDPAEAYAALGSGRSVIVNALFASSNGVEIGLNLTVLTPGGPQRYRHSPPQCNSPGAGLRPPLMRIVIEDRNPPHESRPPPAEYA